MRVPESKLMEPNFGTIYYSIFSVIAYGAAGVIFYLETKRKKFASEKLIYILFSALLGALIGSKLGSALFVYPDFYWKNPSAILYPQVGGKTIVGGLIGGYAGVVIAKKILKVERSTGDLFAPGLALGIAIGRIGCFLNGCCYGLRTNLPWAVNFKGELRHPTQIYESIFCLILFFYLWQMRDKMKKEGDLFKLFLLLYSLFRLYVEFLRADKVPSAFNLSMAQVISGIVSIFMAGYFLKQLKFSANKESL